MIAREKRALEGGKKLTQQQLISFNALQQADFLDAWLSARYIVLHCVAVVVFSTFFGYHNISNF